MTRPIGEMSLGRRTVWGDSPSSNLPNNIAVASLKFRTPECDPRAPRHLREAASEMAAINCDEIKI